MTGSGQFAEIIVNKAVDQVDRVFHYRIPKNLQSLVSLGSLVRVPFGREELEGVVVGFTGEADVPSLKEISAIVSSTPLFYPDLLKLASWIAGYYLCPRVSVFKAMLPAGMKLSGEDVRAKIVNFAYPADLQPEQGPSGPKQEKVLQYLKDKKGLPVPELLAATGVTRSVIQTLQAKGLIRILPREVFRDPQSGENFLIEAPAELTGEQKKALADITAEFQGQGRPVLLFGVTGSGKTEIYLRIAEQMINEGRQSIILVPEIALTPQMVAVFKARLGNRVAVLHSGLSAGERRDAWLAIAAGDFQVVVGARSAVFAPCPRLGLIVIDEEQESCYKQDNIPRFHAREAALERARLAGAQVILGSATPSIETYYKGKLGEYRLVTLEKRVFDQPLPQVNTVDMREELQAGNRSIFSRLLREKIGEHLAQKGQILLFLNRRGYHTFVSCRNCGHVMICPHCAISLTHHSGGGSLKCHYCGYVQDLPRRCPQCGSEKIRQFGAGTQRVENEVKALFPRARVIRADTDTMSAKGSYDRVFGQVRRGEADILVGTQMVAKGLDFPGVTLVGIISADISLNLPEMRAAERTFQLIAQAAGRAGRGEALGEVVLQTYSPREPAIIAAAAQNYPAFFAEELERRREVLYPPFGVMIRVLFSGTELLAVEKTAVLYARFIGNELAAGDRLLGPAPAPLEKIKDRWRVQLILKGKDLDILRAALQTGIFHAGEASPARKGMSMAVDVEPLSMM